MHVLNTTLTLQKGWGGPSGAIVALCEHLAQQDCQVVLCVGSLGPKWGPPIPVRTPNVTVQTVSCRMWPYPRFFFTSQLKKTIARWVQRVDLVHSNGALLPWQHAAAVAARRREIPHVVSPHGMLSPYALSCRRWKKVGARLAYGGRDLRDAACVHALTDNEAADIRAYGLTNPIAVVPNGVDMGEFADAPPRQAAWSRWPSLRERKVVLFLGRIAPIKGLVNLIEAWCRVVPMHRDWHLALVGPDEVGLQAALEGRIQRAGLNEQVSFPGPAYGADKRLVLAAADIFVLPSLSEGFSMAILEGMASSLPVLITSACCFPEAASAGAGLEVDTSVEAIADGLSSLMNASNARRIEMGARGRRLVEERFGWPKIAQQMKSVYEWLLGGGTVPECVFRGVLKAR